MFLVFLFLSNPSFIQASLRGASLCVSLQSDTFLVSWSTEGVDVFSKMPPPPPAASPQALRSPHGVQRLVRLGGTPSPDCTTLLAAYQAAPSQPQALPRAQGEVTFARWAPLLGSEHAPPLRSSSVRPLPPVASSDKELPGRPSRYADPPWLQMCETRSQPDFQQFHTFWRLLLQFFIEESISLSLCLKLSCRLLTDGSFQVLHLFMKRLNHLQSVSLDGCQLSRHPPTESFLVILQSLDQKQVLVQLVSVGLHLCLKPALQTFHSLNFSPWASLGFG